MTTLVEAMGGDVIGLRQLHDGRHSLRGVWDLNEIESAIRADERAKVRAEIAAYVQSEASAWYETAENCTMIELRAEARARAGSLSTVAVAIKQGAAEDHAP